MKYNPEKRAWRGKSYRKGGKRVKDLRDLVEISDYDFSQLPQEFRDTLTRHEARKKV